MRSCIVVLAAPDGWARVDGMLAEECLECDLDTNAPPPGGQINFSVSFIGLGVGT